MTVTPTLIFAAYVVHVVGLAVLAYVTRATPRRLVAAVAGGMAVAIVGVGVEILFQTLGFWHYPSAPARYGPVWMYPVLVLIWAELSLLGWRVTRRFGLRGCLVFLTVLAVVGTVRDYLVAGRLLQFIVVAPGAATVLVDLACWFGLTAFAIAVMRLVAGPATADRLAR